MNSLNGYTESNAFPTSNFDIHTVTYYDDYDFNGDGTDDVAPDPTHLNGATYAHLHGKLTGTRVKVLDQPLTNTWLKTVTFYDKRGRVIQIYAQNHMGGADVTSNQYDFAGRLLRTVRDHSVSGNQLFVASDFECDHAGRLLYTRYGVGDTHTDALNAQVVLSGLEYDQIGQMVEKKLHSMNGGTNFLQNVDFEYNIRGWLKNINNVNDMSAQGSTQLTEISANWYNPHSNGHTYYYSETLLMSGQDGAMEMKYNNNAVRMYCSWRKVNGDGTSSAFMQLVKHNNGKWYLWDKNFSNRMPETNTSFVADEENVRLERVGDEFRVYVGNVLKHTVTELGSSQETLIPVGIIFDGLQTDHAFYRYMPQEGADVFAMRLDYTVSNTTTEAEAQYNGNISQVAWKVMGDTKHSTYGFKYDELNRLTQAKYAQYEITGQTQQFGQPSNIVYSNVDNYTVSNISYDLNGNIQTLDRMGWDGSAFTQIDQMVYTYQNNSNILNEVADGANDGKGFKEINQSGNDYAYDANGNMTSDYNKGITVTYNHLNLPTKILYATGQEIDWTYDAAGVKLYKSTNDGSGNTSRKDYVGGIEYNANLVEALYHSEGRLVPSGSSYQYEYTIKDHLGNARVSFTDLDKNGEVVQSEILQTNHYYPFGLRHEGNDLPQQGATNAYQYNGKELNSDFGLDWLDYGARWYDASIARWSAVDLLAEKYSPISPYVYVANNPIIFIDPNGMEIDFSQLLKEDLEGAINLLWDLADKTGLNLYVNSDGILNKDGYSIDENPCSETCNKEGVNYSQTARDDLIAAIEAKGTINVVWQKPGKVSEHIASTIYLAKSYIDNSDIVYGHMDEKNAGKFGTWGYAMVFFHELGHSSVAIGGRRNDEYFGFVEGVEGIPMTDIPTRASHPHRDNDVYTKGNVYHTNKIRNELGYDNRVTYLPYEIKIRLDPFGVQRKYRVLMFSRESFDEIIEYESKSKDGIFKGQAVYIPID